MNAENVTHFYGFGVDNIPKDIKNFIENKNNVANIYRIHNTIR